MLKGLCPRMTGGYKQYVVYLVLSFIALFPLLNGYIFLLDGVFTPHYKIEDQFYGKTDSITRVPFLLVFKGFSLLVPMDVLQKAALYLILFLSAVSMHHLVKTESSLPKYFAGIMYMINPFVYARFMAGHWLLLLAYALTPWAIASIIKFFKENNRNQSIKTALWITLIGILNIHNLFLILSVFLIFFLYHLIKKDRILKQTAFLAIIFVLLNLFWLVPLLTAPASPVHEITGQDLTVFATSRGPFNHFIHTLMLYGFWREQAYILPMSFIPFYLYFDLFIILLFLAVHGIRCCKEAYKWPILITAVLASLLAVGIAHPWFKDIFLFLFNNLYFMRGFREPHKFLALAAFAYAFFGAYGLDDLIKQFEKHKKAIFVASILLIIAYTPVMFGGFWGQLKPADYPADWYAINDQLNQEEQDFNVLFLPWHGYMDFKFVKNQDKRIANPAKSFFDKNVIQAENIETGDLYTHSVNPIQPYVEKWLKEKERETLIRLNVQYVILAKEVNYRSYLWLLNETSLELVNETDTLFLLKTKARTSKFYQSDDLQRLQPLAYTQNSPVSYTIEEPEARYILFTDAHNAHWELGDQEPAKDTANAYEYLGETTLKYKRFNVYFASYAFSLLFFLLLLFLLRTQRK